MATAIITALAPEILSALPIIVPFIKDQILQMEKIFGAGTGATKLNTVVNNTVGLANNLANLPAGNPNKIVGPLDPTSIATIVETLVQQLKAGPGGLTPETSASSPAAIAAPLAPAPGSTFKITGTFQVGG